MATRELSNGLHQLKFMQRARQREEAVKKAEVGDPAVDESEWVVPPNKLKASRRACVVVMEGDPKPGLPLGRMSFQSFNPEVNKLTEEADALIRKRLLIAKERLDGSGNSANDAENVGRMKGEEGGSSQAHASEQRGDSQNKKPKLNQFPSSTTGRGRAEARYQPPSENKPGNGWRGRGGYGVLRQSRPKTGR